MKFGTSGLRGLVTDLEGRPSALYARAFARHLLESGQAKGGDPILVGRDFRPSSPSISATCIGALSRAGLTPLDCGALPTPALALFGLSIHAPSLMITGSHIPADRNGIKFYRASGEIDKHDEIAISNLADAMAGLEIDSRPLSAPDASKAARSLFIARVTTILPEGALSGLRVGVYQHSTVARDLLVETIRSYGADTIELGHSDAFIPVDTEAVSPETIKLLQGWSIEHRLDAIVSADGDGDRPLVTDETGSPMRGDLLGLVAARFLGAEVVVTPVTSNSGIENRGDFHTVRTKVGSPYVIAGMEQALAQDFTAVVGFEANGGLLTASTFHLPRGALDPLPTRDSFLPILAILSTAAQRKEPLSCVASSFRLPCTVADRLENFPTEISAALMDHLRRSHQRIEAFAAPLGIVKSASDIDGLRITLADDRVVHIRPSGNAPEMRCYVEASNPDDAQSLLLESLDLIRHWAEKYDQKHS